LEDEAEAAEEVVRWARKEVRFVEGGRLVMMIRVDLHEGEGGEEVSSFHGWGKRACAHTSLKGERRWTSKGRRFRDGEDRVVFSFLFPSFLLSFLFYESVASCSSSFGVKSGKRT
jgi:hypothetical protein